MQVLQVKHLHKLAHCFKTLQHNLAAMYHVDNDDNDTNYRYHGIWCEWQFRMGYASMFPADQEAISSSGISPNILGVDFNKLFVTKLSEFPRPFSCTATREQWPCPESRSRSSRKFSVNQLAKSASAANRLARAAFRHRGVIRKSCKVSLSHNTAATEPVATVTGAHVLVSDQLLQAATASRHVGRLLGGGPDDDNNGAVFNFLEY